MSNEISQAAWINVLSKRMNFRTQRHPDFYGEPGSEDPAHFAVVEFSGDVEIDDDGTQIVIVPESVLLAAQAELDADEVTDAEVETFIRDSYDGLGYYNDATHTKLALENFLSERKARQA